MSKIVERYNSSPFANIGKKVSQVKEMPIGSSGFLNTMEKSNVQNSKLADLRTMPLTSLKTAGNIQNPRSIDLATQRLIEVMRPLSKSTVDQPTTNLNSPKNIDLLNSIIETVIIKPYGTLLTLNSVFGNIVVKPYSSLIKLFSSISEAKFITIGKESRLINSPTDKIEDFSFHSRLFELNSKYDDLIEMSKTSVLSFKWPNTAIMDSSSVLSFKRPDMIGMEVSSVLSSNLAKTKEMIFGSVLKRNSIFDDLEPMKKSDVQKYYHSTLDFRSDSVLSQESMSSILDELKTESVLDFDSPNLIIKDVQVSLRKIFDNSGKNALGAINTIPDTYATGFTLKAGSGITLFDMGKIPLRLQPGPFWENAESKEVYDPIIGKNKIAGTTFYLDSQAATLSKFIDKMIPDYMKDRVFITNPLYKQTNYNIIVDSYNGMDKIYSIVPASRLSIVYSRPPHTPPYNLLQFEAKNVNNKNENTEFNLYNVYDNILDVTSTDKYPPLAFDFKNRTGVLNEFSKYYGDSIKLNPGAVWSFKRYVDWSIKKMFSQYTSVENSDLYTPKVSADSVIYIGTRSYISTPATYWGYTEASEKIGNANKYTDLFSRSLSNTANVGLNVFISGILGNQMNSWTSSPTSLAIDYLAGQVHWTIGMYDGALSLIKTSSGGTGLLGSISSAVRTVSTLAARIGVNILPSDLFQTEANGMVPEYGLMVAHILAGTKYTAAYAIYDANASQWSSKFDSVGNYAINLYHNDDKLSQSPSDENVRYFNSAREIDDSLKLSILNRFKSLSDFSTSSDSLLGQNYNGLNVPQLRFEDSILGKYKEFFNKASTIFPWHNSRGTKGGSIEITDAPTISLYTNYEVNDRNVVYLNESPILYRVDNPNVSSNNNSPNKTENAYINHLKHTSTRTLDDLGMPNISINNYTDIKNLSEMFLISKNTENTQDKLQKFIDMDLIDFYFEDITTSDNNESILIPFRAIIKSYNDSTSVDWQSNTYIGRPDKFYIYGGFDRKVSLSFDVAVNSKSELLTSWRKLNHLQGMCYPTSYPNTVAMTAPIMAITVGALLQRVYVVMTSISFSFDQSTIWETLKSAKSNFQLPMYVSVQTDFNVLYGSIPLASGRHFARFEDWIDPLVYDYTPGSSTDIGGYTGNQRDPNRKRIIKNTGGKITIESVPSDPNKLPIAGTEGLGLGITSAPTQISSYVTPLPEVSAMNPASLSGIKNGIPSSLQNISSYPVNEFVPDPYVDGSSFMDKSPNPSANFNPASVNFNPIPFSAAPVPRVGPTIPLP